MKISIFFVLVILITENSTEKRLKRVISAHKTNDILGLLKKSEHFEEFWKTMNDEYFKRKQYWNNASYGGTIRKISFDVNQILATLNYEFMRHSHIYIKLRILEYSELALKIIQEAKNTDKTIREQIRFPENQEYCIFTAFHDYGKDLDLIFESTFFFQTIHPNDEYPMETLKLQFNEYIERYKIDLTWLKRKQSPITESVDSLDKIQQIKQDITRLSNMFCSYCRPFLNHNFNKRDILDDVRNESVFIRHVLLNEMCKISFKKFKEYEEWPTKRPDYYYVESQQDFIIRWNCDIILDNEEYGFQKYKEDVTKRTGKSMNLVKQIKHLFGTKKSIQTVGPDRDESALREYELSLSSFKHKLKSNSNYLNFVIYNNVASKVLLLVAIKEGKKILKGIKHVVLRNCKEVNGISDDKVRELTSTLSLFKSVFDKLVSLILEKKRIDVIDDYYSQKKIFDTQVSSMLMKLFAIPDNQNVEHTQIICSIITNEEIGDAHLGDRDSSNERKLEKFYLTEPILHVTQLCNFVDVNFV